MSKWLTSDIRRTLVEAGMLDAPQPGAKERCYAAVQEAKRESERVLKAAKRVTSRIASRD